MFTNAFGNAGAERRIGISVAYAPKENINIAGGLFGDNESISRGSGAAPGESWGVNGRATWEPLFDPGKIIHLGVSGYYRAHLKSGDTPMRCASATARTSASTAAISPTAASSRTRARSATPESRRLAYSGH